MKKTCTLCKESKVLEDFHNRAKGLHGKHSQCKQCLCDRNKIWKANNPEKVRIIYGNYRERLNAQHKSDDSLRNPYVFRAYIIRKFKTLMDSIEQLAERENYQLTRTKCEECGEAITLFCISCSIKIT